MTQVLTILATICEADIPIENLELWELNSSSLYTTTVQLGSRRAWPGRNWGGP
jgi:hypothetical protein